MQPAMAARILALAGAVLMPVSLFLHWFELESYIEGASFSVKGWDVFEATDTLMVLAAIATLVLIATTPRQLGRALMILGALTAGFISVQLVAKPGSIGFADRSDLSLEIGAWLGLLGALLIVVAGALAARPERR
jgi:hypothetical protein